jgi:hypothetical protein
LEETNYSNAFKLDDKHDNEVDGELIFDQQNSHLRMWLPKEDKMFNRLSQLTRKQQS